MQRFALRLAIVIVALLVASQFAIPPLVSRQVAKDLTAHGGHADVHVSAFPALRLLFRHGKTLTIDAQRLSVDLGRDQQDVFRQLDNFSNVKILIKDSRAGPFTISDFGIKRIGSHDYELGVIGHGAAGDIARYAGDQLAGSFGQALAGLAAASLGAFARDIPFDATMGIDTSTSPPTAHDVTGDVAGLPAGPLAQVVANALLSGL